VIGVDKNDEENIKRSQIVLHMCQLKINQIDEDVRYTLLNMPAMKRQTIRN